MNTYKVTKKVLTPNADGTKTQSTVTIESGLTWEDAKAMRKDDQDLQIVKE